MLAAACIFALLYVAFVPFLFLAVLACLTWEMLRWLLFSALFVPVLAALGLLGLLKGLLPVGLLIGAVAARAPDRLWPKALLAMALPLVDLLLLRGTVGGHLVERAALWLIDRRALFILDTAAPLAASMLAALLIPRRLIRRVLAR